MNKDFLWGASSSSFQAEGMWQKAGQGASVIELDQANNIESFKKGVDFYHRFPEDIEYMKKAGLKAFRFSISWPRIFPEGSGQPNIEGINYYQKIIKQLREAKIEPIVTIYHFDYPLALVKRYGGWISKKSIGDYLSYCRYLFEQLGNQVKYWITINEQDHVIKIPTRLGIKSDSFAKHMQECYQANHNMSVGSALAIKLCHEMIPDAKIGPALSYQPYYPASNQLSDKKAAQYADLLTQKYLLDLQCKGFYSQEFKNYLQWKNVNLDIKANELDEIKQNHPDFIGINYYSSNIVQYLPPENKYGQIEGHPVPKKEFGLYEIKNDPRLDTTKWGWSIDPKGLKIALKNIYSQYHLPLLITENGFGDQDHLVNGNINDQDRVNYLKAHINKMLDAIKQNIPVLGYCIWSFTDVISGHNGSNKRYGLIYVDQNMDRIPKKSFMFYQALIKQMEGVNSNENNSY